MESFIEQVLRRPTCAPFQSSPRSLLQRELAPERTEYSAYGIGFTPAQVRSLRRCSRFSFKHHGCVNTCAFSADGTLLCTGSDDTHIKVWHSTSFNDPTSIKLKCDLVTSHSSNIFHAMFVPQSQNRQIVSCAADGEIWLHDLGNPGQPERRLYSNEFSMVNTFSFSSDSPSVLYAATFQRTSYTSFGGSVVGIDLRSADYEFELVSSTTQQVKVVEQCPFDPYIVAVGIGNEVWFMDSRNRQLVDKITMEGISLVERRCRNYLDGYLPIHGAHYNPTRLARTNESLRTKETLLTNNAEISVSSIEFSKLNKELLVSFQGDLIYRYNFHQKEFPIQFYAGHVNEMTFLKRATYLGFNEEYVCSGGDDGNVFIFDTESGKNVLIKRGDGVKSSYRNELTNGIVNGVVPHPTGNCLVTYGLDSDAKLWICDAENDPASQAMKDYEVRALRNNEQTVCESYGITLAMQLIRCSRLRESEEGEERMSSSVKLLQFDEGRVFSDFEQELEYVKEKAEQYRLSGNEQFHINNFRNAKRYYSCATNFCSAVLCLKVNKQEQFPALFLDISKLLVTLYLNLAQTCIKLMAYDQALEYARLAKKMEPANTKARFRMAIALRELNRKREALEELIELQSEIPGGDTSLVRDTIEKLKKRI